MALKERNIYKRKDGRFEGRFIKGRRTDGKAIYGAVYARSYAEVKEKLVRAKIENSNLWTKHNVKQSVAKVVEKYLETLKTRIKPSTYWVYHGYIENHIQPHFGNMLCYALTMEATQDFVNTVFESGLSATTVQSVFCLLKNGLKGKTDSDISQIILPKRQTNEANVLSLEEQKKLEAVALASDDINRIGIILCLYTGVRVGELCAAVWNDIDFVQGQLYVRRTIQRIKCNDGSAKTQLVTQAPKTASSQRSIPLPKFLLLMLKEHHAKSTSNFIISCNGHAVEPRSMQFRFKTLLKVADIESGSIHMTRHVFTTRALENGMDIKTLSEILGHSSPIITLKKYAHVLDDHKRKSMESLATIFQK